MASKILLVLCAFSDASWHFEPLQTLAVRHQGEMYLLMKLRQQRIEPSANR
jgi:hypothetical protein